jgi:HK97 family phage major capsid protein
MEVRTLIDSTGGIDYATDAANGAGLLRPIGDPFIPPQTIRRTRLFMRDVLTSTNTTLALVPYIQELNAEAIANASGAFFVGEGQPKPETQLSFTPADAPIRKIAAWIPATYEILQDAPTLRGYIDQRLQYMVALREEKAILNGSGTAPEIRGLRQQSGKQTQSAVANDPFATIGLGIGKIEIAQGEASFIAMNPGDYWATVVGRHTSLFDGQTYNGSAPFNTPPAQIWGVPVVRTISIETTKVLVGARQGAVILDREGTVIRVGDQHSDYFTSNKVAILAEKRMGLAVHRPDWYVECTISLP